MKTNKKILAVLVICIIIRFLFAFPLDNFQLPVGSDHSFHLFQIWYAAGRGVTKWNYYWDAGETIFRFYPPLAHMFGGALGNIVGFLLAYKLVSNIFMALAPIAFFYFLKEFKLSEGKIILALIFFTLILVYPYYLFDGRYTSIVNLVFILVFWTFLKRAIDQKKLKYLILSSIFLSFSILTHHTTTLMILPIIFAWAILYKLQISTFYRIAGISMLSLLLTSWWVIPFVVETTAVNQGGYANVVSVGGPSSITNEVITRLNNLGILAQNLESLVIISLVALTTIGCMLAFFKIKEKNVREFLIVALLMLLILSVFKFKRAFIFLPIPVSIFVAEGVSLLKGKVKVVFSVLLFASLFFSFIIPRPQLLEYPEYPNVPEDGRVIFQPFGNEFNFNQGANLYHYSVLLAPMHGNENIFPWYVLATKDVGSTSTTFSIEKTVYDSLLQDPMKMQSAQYYNLLKEGHVNYIVVNKNYKEFVDYYNVSSNFKIREADEKYVIFELSPKSSYVEVNGMGVENELHKGNDKIDLEFDCDVGSITVKETYNRNWVAHLNGREINLSYTDHGFIEIKNDDAVGRCNLELVFQEKIYYTLSVIASVITWVFFVGYIAMLMFKRKSR